MQARIVTLWVVSVILKAMPDPPRRFKWSNEQLVVLRSKIEQYKATNRKKKQKMRQDVLHELEELNGSPLPPETATVILCFPSDRSHS